IEDRTVVIKNALRAVTVMHVPIQNGDPIDLLVLLLRISRGDGDVVEKTETHRAIRRGVMARRPDGHKRVFGRAFDYSVYRATRGARSAHRSFQRFARHHRVRVQITTALADRFFDVFEMLRRVTGLNIAASGFVGFDLDDPGPQIFIAAPYVDRHAIAFGPLRMMLPGLMFFENRMVNHGGV